MSKSLNLFVGAAFSVATVMVVAYNYADRNVAPMPENPAIVSFDVDPDFALIASAQAAGSGMREGKFNLGRPALDVEVAAWDWDVSPDGTGLPDGSGNAYDGEELFAEHCAVCHGDFAEGVDNWPKLAGGMDTLDHEDPLKTVGSYWPHLSTAFDYVRRSMPFGNAGSLTDDETYAIVAYILYSNDLIDDEFELSRETFFDVEMPNANGFIMDDRAETEYTIFTTENACMSDCKDSVEITMRAAVLDVTPEEEGVEQVAAPVAVAEIVQVAVVEKVVEEAAPTAASALDAELVKAGEKAFKKCKACHQVGEGATNKSGPQLNGVVGRAIGSLGDFKYSNNMAAMGAEGVVWNDETLAAFLAKPKAYIKGTKMSFSGFKKEEDIAATIEYLKSFSQ
ncbi:MAG: c-type cytochrome [Paracoccaceae bacterium]